MLDWPSPRAWLPAALALIAAAAVLGAHDPGGVVAHAGDGRLHDAYAYAVAAGALPPEDPLHLGQPPTVAWAWHVALSALSSALDVPPWRASAWLSAACAAALVAAMWAATGLYTRRVAPRAAFAWAPFVLLDPLASFGGSPGPANLTAALVAYDPFATGLALVAAATLLLLSRRWSSRPRLISALLIGLLAPLLCPPAALALVPLGVAPVIAAAWENRGDLRARAVNVLRESSPGLGLLAGLFAGSAALPSAVWASFAPGPGLPSAPWALLPGALLVAIAAARWGRLTRTSHMLAVAVFGLTALPLLLGDAATRSALTLLAAPLDAVLLLALLDELAPAWRGSGRRQTRLRTIAAAAALGLAASALLSTPLALRSAAAAAPAPYVASGSDTDLALGPRGPAPLHRMAAWRWLRETTPASAVIVEEPVPAARLDLPVVTRRRALVSLDGSGPYHDVLVERATDLVRGLGACELSSGDVARLFSTPAPWPRTVYAITPIPPGGSACEALPKGVSLVYRNPGYAIYVVLVPRR